MSIDAAYVRRALNGAVRLGLRDPKAWSSFELTLAGFFRSFYAIGLAAPIYAFLALGTLRITQSLPGLEDGEAVKNVSLTFFVIFHAANYLGSALIFLAAMVPLARMLGLQARYVTLAITYNWGTLVVQLIYLPPVVLLGLGLIPPIEAASLHLILTGFTLYFRFALIRAALDLPWPAGFALALIDLLMQMVWFMILTSIV